MVAMVSSGITDIAVADFFMNKEKYKFVSFTNVLGFER
jgi:hypothetical protein